MTFSPFFRSNSSIALSSLDLMFSDVVTAAVPKMSCNAAVGRESMESEEMADVEGVVDRLERMESDIEVCQSFRALRNPC